ncbi:MAG: hypothetical protein JXR25_13800 [Pontiellaceae bacterium]|nr:hypothetical protein [Pontiellaceae bacterium]
MDGLDTKPPFYYKGRKMKKQCGLIHSAMLFGVLWLSGCNSSNLGTLTQENHSRGSPDFGYVLHDHVACYILLEGTQKRDYPSMDVPSGRIPDCHNEESINFNQFYEIVELKPIDGGIWLHGIPRSANVDYFDKWMHSENRKRIEFCLEIGGVMFISEWELSASRKVFPWNKHGMEVISIILGADE